MLSPRILFEQPSTALMSIRTTRRRNPQNLKEGPKLLNEPLKKRSNDSLNRHATLVEILTCVRTHNIISDLTQQDGRGKKTANLV